MPTCRHCKNPFEIGSWDREFYKKLDVPEPTWCPECRMMRRYAFRNERNLYKRECDFSKKNIVSLYSPEKPFIVYDADIWWSDKWDPLDYGQEFDFSRPFFEQFAELRRRVPRINISNMQSVNSYFTNHAADNKNCYMLFACENNEDSYYGKLVQDCRNVVDCNFIYNSELCYECISCYECYECAYLQDCHACRNTYFSKDLRKCTDCIGCWNLRDKKYCIANKEYSKEEFGEMKKKFKLGSFTFVEKQKEFFQKNFNGMIVPNFIQANSEDSIGDYLEQCKNVQYSFDVTRGEECRYVTDALDPKNVMDSSFIYYRPEFCLETLSTLELNAVKYSMFIYFAHDISYSEYCYHSGNLFGCEGLKKNEYCILNKPYAKEDYHRMVKRIIEHMKKTGEWGEFFPVEMSAFDYNETVAQEYFPKTEKEAETLGWTWKEKNRKEFLPSSTVIPDSIEEVPDSIKSEILACGQCGKNYRIIEQELEFYRKIKLPIPRKCPDCRHTQRMEMRNPRTLWTRKCGECGKEIRTTYARERTERVCCERCYMKGMY